MPYVTTDDKTQLYVKDWGSGRPVILLHGWPLSADSWDDQAVAIAEAGYRVIAYDRRGFGRSSQPWQGYDYDTLTDDLSAVIEQAAVQDAVLVGFSMGGGEVARYMSRYGSKTVVKAALISSVVPFMLKTDDNPQGKDQADYDAMDLAIREDRAGFFAEFFRTFFGVTKSTQTVSESTLAWAHQMAMQASLKATLECAKSFSSTDFRDDLSAFKVPTLIIHGTQDQTVSIKTTSRSAAKRIANATLIEYDGAPHGLFATDKARLTKDLLAFLAS